MELIITPELKRRAKKRRVKQEKKWRTLRISCWICLALAVFFFIFGIFYIPYGNYEAFGICGLLFAIFLILFVVFRALLSNFTSHWVTDRLNEQIWIEDGMLNHFIQTSFAAGINSRNADEKGYLFLMDISTIKNAIHDPKSGRIEFNVKGKGIHYSNVRTKSVDKEWPLTDFPAVFYDYTDPGLVETLKTEGVAFKDQEIKFKIRDDRI